MLRETGTAADDGQKDIFVNTAADDGTRISELMSCFTQKQVMNRNLPVLSEAVNRLKTTEGWMTAMSDILRSFIEEGRQEGFKEGCVKTLYQLVNNHILSMDEAVKQSGVTEEEFLKIASQPFATV